jgi:acetyltransferase-like isoleucine patch superfamily enzyme
LFSELFTILHIISQLAKDMTGQEDHTDVRGIVTADAPYAGNVRRIPQDIQQRARRLCWKYNTADPSDGEAQAAILKELLGTWSEHLAIMPHVQFDYGINTHFAGGHVTLVNFYCVFLDTSPIYIGRDVFIGPKCVLACAGHPVNPEQRLAEPLTQSKPIHIGNNVWLGASVTVIGGVSIGDGSVIAAGAVVTRDIPAGVVAGGVPCRVMRPITEADRIKPEEILF